VRNTVLNFRCHWACSQAPCIDCSY
jgi:hypothetical protein